MELVFAAHCFAVLLLKYKKLLSNIPRYCPATDCKSAPAGGEDKRTVMKIINTMLTKSKFKDFFNKNIAAL